MLANLITRCPNLAVYYKEHNRYLCKQLILWKAAAEYNIWLFLAVL